MKARTATIVIVSLLLGISALSVGGRLYVDAKASTENPDRAPAKAKSDGAGITLLPVAPAGKTKLPPLEDDGLMKQLRALAAIGNEADRTQAVLDLVSRFKPEDWERALSREALRIVSKPGPPEPGGIQNLIVSAWAELDPEAAMAWAGTGGFRGFQVLTAWIGKDPDAALDYMRDNFKNGNNGNNAAMLGKVIEALGNDLPRIARAIREVPEDCREIATMRAHPSFKNLTNGEMKSFVDSLDPPFKTLGFHLLIDGLSGYETRIALTREFPELTLPWTYRPIYQEWSKSDSSAAIQSVAELPAGKMREAALGGILSELGKRENLSELFATTRRFSEEISDERMADLIAGAVRNEANRSGHLFIIAEDDKPPTGVSGARNVDLALAEIPRIESEKLQEQLYRHVLTGWMLQDRAAAKKWIEQNDLPEGLHKEFEDG